MPIDNTQQLSIAIAATGGDQAAAEVRKTTDAVQQHAAAVEKAAESLRKLGTSGGASPYDAIAEARKRIEARGGAAGGAGGDGGFAGALAEIDQLERRKAELDATLANVPEIPLGGIAAAAGIAVGGFVKLVTALEEAQAASERMDRAYARLSETLDTQIATTPVAALGNIRSAFDELEERVERFKDKSTVGKLKSVVGDVLFGAGDLTEARKSADQMDSLAVKARAAAAAAIDRNDYENRINQAVGEGNKEMADRLRAQLAFSDEVKGLAPALKLLSETERDAVIRSVEARTTGKQAAEERAKQREEEAEERDQQNRDEIAAIKDGEAERKRAAADAHRAFEDFAGKQSALNRDTERDRKAAAAESFRAFEDHARKQSALNRAETREREEDEKAAARRVAAARVAAEKAAQDAIDGFNRRIDAAKAGLGETPQQRADRLQAGARDRQAERIVRGRELERAERDDPGFDRLAPSERAARRGQLARQFDANRRGEQAGIEDLVPAGLPEKGLAGNVADRVGPAMQPAADAATGVAEAAASAAASIAGSMTATAGSMAEIAGAVARFAAEVAALKAQVAALGAE